MEVCYIGCWREHHNCAVVMIESLLAIGPTKALEFMAKEQRAQLLRQYCMDCGDVKDNCQCSTVFVS